MSSVTELDIAIQRIDDLLNQLQGGQTSKATPATANQESKAGSKEAKKASKKANAGAASAQQPGQTKAKSAPGTSAQPADSVPDDLFAKAQLQVAQVTSVEEIDSAKLYKCQVDIGNGATKQVMAGLKQHIAKDDLLHSLVVVITNLKPAKLAGNMSEAMILAAQTPAPDKPQGELVQSLQPPEGAKAGDPVYLEGQAPGSAFPKTLKSDIWKRIVLDLQVHSSVACYTKQKLVTAAGSIHLPASMPDGAGIH